MQMYVILRRGAWADGVRSEAAAARSTVEGDAMPDDIRWIRSYVLAETDGSLGTVCIYQASSPEAIREHAKRVGMPADEIIAVADTVIVRPDPEPSRRCSWESASEGSRLTRLRASRTVTADTVQAFGDGGLVSVNQHPYKVSVHETESSPGIPERGWLNMDVRWLITKDTVGASKTVFGITYFPPGSKHELHRHPNAEEVEYLISGSGIAYVDDDAVELGPGEVVFVPQNAYHGFENNSDARGRDGLVLRRRREPGGCRLRDPARGRGSGRLGRDRESRSSESSIESVFLRPTTNQTASTVSFPTVAKRCGCVQSNAIVSPGPISYVSNPIETCSVPARM